MLVRKFIKSKLIHWECPFSLIERKTNHIDRADAHQKHHIMDCTRRAHVHYMRYIINSDPLAGDAKYTRWMDKIVQAERLVGCWNVCGIVLGQTIVRVIVGTLSSASSQQIQCLPCRRCLCWYGLKEKCNFSACLCTQCQVYSVSSDKFELSQLLNYSPHSISQHIISVFALRIFSWRKIVSVYGNVDNVECRIHFFSHQFGLVPQ